MYYGLLHVPILIEPLIKCPLVWVWSTWTNVKCPSWYAYAPGEWKMVLRCPWEKLYSYYRGHFPDPPWRTGIYGDTPKYYSGISQLVSSSLWCVLLFVILGVAGFWPSCFHEWGCCICATTQNYVTNKSHAFLVGGKYSEFLVKAFTFWMGIIFHKIVPFVKND